MSLLVQVSQSVESEHFSLSFPGCLFDGMETIIDEIRQWSFGDLLILTGLGGGHILRSWGQALGLVSGVSDNDGSVVYNIRQWQHRSNSLHMRHFTNLVCGLVCYLWFSFLMIIGGGGSSCVGKLVVWFLIVRSH